MAKENQVPEFLQDQFSGEEVNGRENIHIEKKLYGAKSMKDIIDNGFSELASTPPPKTTKQFFEMYKELFYDIPKAGKDSHTSLMEDSLNYIRDYIDPKDEVIDELNEEIEKLLARVDELENPEEHAYYKNGSVLSSGGGGSYYYMEKGKKRSIVGGKPGEVWAALKASLGHNPDDDDFENNIVVIVPRNVINQIPSGPTLDLEDLGNGKPITPRELKALIDPDGGWKVNPDRYQSVEEYQVALENEIVEAWDLERNLENQYNKWKSDAKRLETKSEREDAKDRRDSFLRHLERQRRKLAAYKRIYDAIESNEDITINGLEDIYDNLVDNNYEDITEDEMDQFRGWEKGDSGIEKLVSQGSARYYKGRGTKYT